LIKSERNYPKVLEILVIASLTIVAITTLVLDVIYFRSLRKSGLNEVSTRLYSILSIILGSFEFCVVIIDTAISYIFLSIIFRIKQQLSEIESVDTMQRSNSTESELVKVGKRMSSITGITWILVLFTTITSAIMLEKSTDITNMINSISYFSASSGVWFSVIFQNEVRRLMEYSNSNGHDYNMMITKTIKNTSAKTCTEINGDIYNTTGNK